MKIEVDCKSTVLFLRQIRSFANDCVWFGKQLLLLGHCYPIFSTGKQIIQGLAQRQIYFSVLIRKEKKYWVSTKVIGNFSTPGIWPVLLWFQFLHLFSLPLMYLLAWSQVNLCKVLNAYLSIFCFFGGPRIVFHKLLLQ